MDDDSQDHMKAFTKTLDRFQECFKNAVRRIIVPHLRQRNASLRISKLPVELMQRIFHATLSLEFGERPKKYVTTLLTLRSVSEAWRDLTNKTPTLWTHLSSEDHPSFISKAFEISGNCPLHLRYTVGRVEGFELKSFLDQALARVHCWESVSIHDPDRSDLRNYFQHPAPGLKRITLTRREWWDTADGSHFSICGGSWELVEEVRIKDYFYELDWSGIRCRRLRILDILAYKTLDLVLIIGIIRENQYLEELKLERIEFTPTPSLHNSSRPPIVLSHLRALTLVDLDFHDDPDFDPSGQDPPAFHISRNIRFPPCTDFSSSLYGPEDLDGRIDLEYLTTSSPHPPDILSLASLETALSAANSLVAYLDSPTIILTTDDDVPQSVKFSVYIWSAPQFFLRSWIGDVVARKLEESQLEMKLVPMFGGQASELDVLVEFKDCEAVTELSVDPDSSDMSEETRNRLLHLLAMPYTSGSGTIGIPFPRLRHIDAPTLLQGAEGGDILNMIKTRFNATGFEVNVPETIVVHWWYGEKSFQWPNLDGIREMSGFRAITFI
ncbi:hypothetical protein FRC01_009734 [Tulasnella sp. 417]|nr:hypothetical protein FRC01_009734 [Tulasnella sp. 417]